MKIIEHCQSTKEGAFGKLFGLDLGDTDRLIDVADAHPMLSMEVFDEESSSAAANYESSLQKSLRTANFDHGICGLYIGAFNSGTFLTTAVIDAMAAHQRAIPNAILIVYDPLMSGLGRVGIKAYRLSKQFLDVWRERKGSIITGYSIEEFSCIHVLESITVTVSSPFLISAISNRLFASSNCSTLEGGLSTRNSIDLTTLLAQRLCELTDTYVQEQGRNAAQLNRRKKKIEESKSLVCTLANPSGMLDCLVAKCNLLFYADYCREALYALCTKQ